jgi:hypothetical protein
MFWRTGWSETPVTSHGPAITRSRMWGSWRTPYSPAIAVLASDQSCGRTRSWTGPSVRLTKAAVTASDRPSRGWARCASRRPRDSPRASSGRCRGAPRARRRWIPPPAPGRPASPATSGRCRRPYPVVSWWNEKRKTYSPSAGKVCIDRGAAPGAERRALDPLRLGHPPRNPVLPLERAWRWGSRRPAG